jgi:hypothetical protein
MRLINFVFAALFFTVLGNAYADDPHRNTKTITTLTSEGVSLGIAMSQIHFDNSTNSLQGGFGAGSYNDETALSFGLGKRFKEKILVNGKVGTEKGKLGFGIGVNWSF